MMVCQLIPRPEERLRFTLKSLKFAPASDGCYVLATFSGEILYVGLTDDLHRRFREHRDDSEKCKVTDVGAAFWFYYLLSTPAEVARIERTWMNEHMEAHGTLPVLNKAYSPVN